MNINQQIAVMQAYARGERIEYRRAGGALWEVCFSPVWDWVHFEYRVAPPKPVVIQYKRCLCERFGGSLCVRSIHRGEAVPDGFVRWIDQVWQEYQP